MKNVVSIIACNSRLLLQIHDRERKRERERERESEREREIERPECKYCNNIREFNLCDSTYPYVDLCGLMCACMSVYFCVCVRARVQTHLNAVAKFCCLYVFKVVVICA